MAARTRAWLSRLALAALLPVSAPAHEDLLGRIAALTEQMRTNGASDELIFLRAELCRAHQDWESALRDYNAVSKGWTNSLPVEFGRAQALAGAGRLMESRAAFDRLIQGNPANAAALLGRARVLARLDQAPQAIADYSRAFTNQANPHPEDFLDRARLQAAENGPAAAARGLDEGLARLGWTLTLQQAAMDYDQAGGDNASALARLETIIARANRKESWLVLKGEILQKAGRTAEARDAMQTALKAIGDLPPRLSASEKMVALRARIEAALSSLKPAGETAP
jgi:tetratricopeptide (TPR) repeat protein